MNKERLVTIGMKLEIKKKPGKVDGWIFLPIVGQAGKTIPDFVPEEVKSEWEKEYETCWRFKNVTYYKTPSFYKGNRLRATLKKWLGRAIGYLAKRDITEVNILIPAVGRELHRVASDIFEIPLYMTYDASYFKTFDKKALGIKKINFIAPDGADIKALETLLEEVNIIIESVNNARHLTDLPANYLTPISMFEEARRLEKYGIKVEKLPQKIVRQMGGLNAVGAGSHHEPVFIRMELNPSEDRPIVLVGKGVTFDSGGISLKARKGMHEEKGDMAGAAAVIAVLKGLAKMGYTKRIVGLIPAVENLPGGGATRNGDVITAYNGKTIEILNTDAEGRLILADAFSYASELNPVYLIDIATLTGSILRALGHKFTGYFCNDSKLNIALKSAAEFGDELVWQMPLHPEFAEEMKGRLADYKNMPSSAEAASCTAAAFLEFFVATKWAHLDIAGSYFDPNGTSYRQAGTSTGAGVKILLNTLLGRK